MIQTPLNGKDQQSYPHRHTERIGQQKEYAFEKMAENIGDRPDDLLIDAEDRRNRSAGKSGDDKRHADCNSSQNISGKRRKRGLFSFLCCFPFLRGQIGCVPQ